MLFYSAALPLSRQTLTYTARIIRRHRRQTGSRWRKLNSGQQALLVLVYLRKGETFAELAAGFGVGTATAWRYVTETVALLAARSPKLRQAVARAKEAGYAYLVIDGTLIPIDRVAADRPFYSGKHRRHGMNLQVISAPDGEIVWVSGPLPGAVHDLTAARIWGIVAELAASGLIVLADKGYAGASEHIRAPYKGKNKPAPQPAAAGPKRTEGVFDCDCRPHPVHAHRASGVWPFDSALRKGSCPAAQTANHALDVLGVTGLELGGARVQPARPSCDLRQDDGRRDGTEHRQQGATGVKIIGELTVGLPAAQVFDVGISGASSWRLPGRAGLLAEPGPDQEPGEPGVAQGSVHVFAGQRLKRHLRSGKGGFVRLPLALQLAIQALFAPEVVVHKLLVHPGPLGDVLHPGGCVALGGELVEGGGEQLAPGPLSVTQAVLGSRGPARRRPRRPYRLVLGL